ncbi:MAG: hypothetical protein ISP74_07570 [Bacteroidia bacterium]|nr:hypothetical protein [Bacteroidia bacterium]
MDAKRVIEQINDEVYEVVSNFVTLKKAGINYKACCPFHNEKTASFSVNPAKGIFKCFGCDKGGNAIEFQKMQTEYKDLLLNLQQKQKVVTSTVKTNSAENELINELGRLAKVLIKKQVPQNYLRQKMQSTESVLNKGLLNGIVRILDEL